MYFLGYLGTKISCNGCNQHGLTLAMNVNHYGGFQALLTETAWINRKINSELTRLKQNSLNVYRPFREQLGDTISLTSQKQKCGKLPKLVNFI